MAISLFEHNRKAYDAAVSMLHETGKAAIVHPTGTGKSFIGFKLCEDNPDKFICWLSPSEYIFKTQLENLAATGAEVSENITFFTYTKLMMMREEEIDEIQPEYIILDEFHRCGAEMWGQGVQNILNQYPNALILGLSATNIRYLDNQRDMADELFDGNIASYMTLGEAIVRGILNPPTYVTALYSYQKEYEKYKQRVENARYKAVRDAGEKYLDALRRALEKAEGLDEIFRKNIPDTHGKYILFCSDKEHMDEMMSHPADWFAKVDPSPRMYSVYSADPEASKAFSSFKEDKDEDHLRLLYCIDALNEGIHLEDISGVVLFRPTVSPIVFKQQIGRAMSASKRKHAVILDIVDNIGSLYSISAVQEEMQSVVNYYRGRDERQNIVNETFEVIDELRDCRQLFDALEGTLSASWDLMYAEATSYFTEHHDLLVKHNYVTEAGYNLGIWVDTQKRIRAGKVVGSLSKEQIKKLDDIGMCWLTRNERLWEDSYNSAKDFFISNGHLSVSADMPTLKTWIIRQRQRYREHTITDEQYERLSEIGMIWNIDDIWEGFFEKASAYYAEHGDLDIPVSYVTDDGVKLGRWYRSMRNTYRDGQLSQEKQKRLESIGMDWTSVKLRTWMRYYNAAASFYHEYGNLHIGSTYKTRDELNLGIWISSQRYSYSLGRLRQEQIELLEKIGMDWQRYETRWEDAFAQCEAYSKEHHHLDIEVDYVTPDGLRLGAWLATQRNKYRTGTLSQERIQRLESLGIRWEVADADWLKAYALLQGYLSENDTFAIQRDYTVDGFQLYGWVANQRTKYKTGRLASWKIGKLNAIGFPWAPYRDRWQTAFEYAECYCKENGNLDASQTYVTQDGFSLGTWLSTQRKQYANCKLDTQKIALLDGLGFKWSPREAAWKQGYAEALQYYEKNGHLNFSAAYVTENGYKLGEWIRSQIRMYQRGALTAQRQKQLENLGMDFDSLSA